MCLAYTAYDTKGSLTESRCPSSLSRLQVPDPTRRLVRVFPPGFPTLASSYILRRKIAIGWGAQWGIWVLEVIVAGISMLGEDVKAQPWDVVGGDQDRGGSEQSTLLKFGFT